MLAHPNGRPRSSVAEAPCRSAYRVDGRRARLRRLIWVVVFFGTWAGSVRPARASCTAADVAVSITPLLAPSDVIPVSWRLGSGCATVETGLLLGRTPGALAPAGQPLHGPGPEFHQDLPVTESGPWWLAVYVRDEGGTVLRTEPRPVYVFVPPRLPDDPHGSHGIPPLMAGDAYFLQPAGEPHYASLRSVVSRNRRFTTQTVSSFVRSAGFDTRTIASTRRQEVLDQQTPPLEVGGRTFAVDLAGVLATLDRLDDSWRVQGYPRSGLYSAVCHVSAQFLPTAEQTGPDCFAQDFPYDGWVAYGEVHGPEGFQSIRSTLAYFIPRPPEGKRVQGAKLRVFAFRQRGTTLLDIPLSGKRPVSAEPMYCPGFICMGWVTWDFTEEARVLASQGGGELPLTLDPVPMVDGMANYGLSPRWNYPWEHGNENHALTLTFEEGCPQELEVSVTPSTLAPIIPTLLKGEARTMPTEATVEAVVKTCAAAGETPQPVEVTFEVEPPAAGTGEAAGHLHASHPRPTGVLQDLDRGQATDRCTVKTFTDGLGSCAVAYRAGEISGLETVVGRAEGFAEATATVTVKVPGLQNLAVFSGSRIWRLTGERPGLHTDNHWTTDNTLAKAVLMAAQVYEDYAASMGVNDMSLVWGGMFDIGGDWDGSFHRTHRLGTGVDIDGCALSLIPDNPNPQSNEEKQCPAGWVVLPREDYFKGVCKEQDGRLANEGTIHCEFPQ